MDNVNGEVKKPKYTRTFVLLICLIMLMLFTLAFNIALLNKFNKMQVVNTTTEMQVVNTTTVDSDKLNVEYYNAGIKYALIQIYNITSQCKTFPINYGATNVTLVSAECVRQALLQNP